MLGIKTHCYASLPQESLESQQVITGSDALKLLKMWEITPTHNAEIREDYHPDTRDATEDIALDQGPHEVSGESYLLGGGSQGVPPDLSRVYATAFEESIVNQGTIAGTLESENMVTVAEIDGYWERGDLLKIEPGSGPVYVLVLSKSFNDISGNYEYTFWPPLDEDVPKTVSIKANVNYHLENDNEEAITVYTVDDSSAVTGVGTTFSKFTFKFARGQTAKVEMSGQCRDIKRMMITELDGDIGGTSDDNQITLADPTCEPGAVICLTDDSEPANVEYIELGYSPDNLTFSGCNRGFGGTTIRAWTDETEVTGYDLDDTTVGSPIRGIYGFILLGPEDDDVRSLYMPADMEASVTIDEKHSLQGAYGDGGKVVFKLCPENREVTVSVAGYCEDNMISSIHDAVASRPMRVLIQCGDNDGRSFAIALPKVQFNPPLIGDSKGDATKVTLESRAVMFDSDNQLDSVVFAY